MPASHSLFLHANGFAPGAYRQFLDALSPELSITAPPLRALTDAKPSPKLRWADLAVDALRALDEAGIEQAIAIGHSMGATILSYAVARWPERFSSLVLIEPAMVSPWASAAMHRLPVSLRRSIQPAKSTLAKRDHWPDAEAFRVSCERSGLYRDVSTDVMEDFVTAALKPVEGGVGLRFPKAWEAHFYMTPANPIPALAQIQRPVIGLRGRSSIYLDDRRWNRVTRAQARGWYEQHPQHGHLIPLEAPQLTAQRVKAGLRHHRLLDTQE